MPNSKKCRNPGFRHLGAILYSERSLKVNDLSESNVQVKDMAKLQTPEEIRGTILESIEACNDLIGMAKDEIKKLKKEAENYKDIIDEYIKRAFRITSCETTIKGLNVLKELYEKYLDGQLDKQSRDLLRRAVILHNSIFFERKPEETKRINKEKFADFQAGFKKAIEYAKKIKKN